MEMQLKYCNTRKNMIFKKQPKKGLLSELKNKDENMKFKRYSQKVSN